MIQSREVGAARVTRVLEYSGPTHPPEFLFPDLPREALLAEAGWMAPHHYVPAMDRLVVTIQLWLVRAGDEVILVDTGVGNRKTRDAPRMHDLNTLVLPWLEAAGATRESVTRVLHTHLHGDHVGWNTVPEDGRWVPTFPNARYVMPRLDYEFYEEATRRGSVATVDRAFADSVRPVVEAGLVDFVEADGPEIAGCLSPEPTPGHSPGQVAYRLRSDGEEALFCADVFHSPLQIAMPLLNTRYCALPEQARETRARVLREAAERETLLLPMHFGAPYCGYVRRQEGRQGEGYRFEPATW